MRLTGDGRGRPVSSPRAVLANNGAILTLSDVSRSDAGSYRCAASNGVGRDAHRELELRVLREFLLDFHFPSRLEGLSPPVPSPLLSCWPAGKCQIQAQSEQVDRHLLLLS